MFIQVSVILFTGGGLLALGGVPAPRGGVPGPVGGACSWGVGYLVQWGVPAPGGVPVRGPESSFGHHIR